MVGEDMSNNTTSTNEILQQLIAVIKKHKEIDEIVENELLAYLGKQGENVVRILKEQKLIKLELAPKINLWEVIGKRGSYLIIEDYFCECKDFQIRVIGQKKQKYCYHILTKLIGEKTGLYKVRKLTQEEYSQLIEKRLEKISSN